MSELVKLTAAPTPRSRGKPWTTNEVATMRALYHDHTAFDVGRAVGRTAEAVRQKAITLGLSTPTAARIRWTADATARLRADYRRGDTRQLARDLGTTVAAVCKQAQALGLARPRPRHPWTPEKDRLLRELYGLVATEDIAARLGYSRSGVYNRLRQLGINRASAAAARYARDQAEIGRLRERGPDDGDGRRAAILLAYRLQAVGAEEAAVALGVPVARLAVELGRAAARGQALVAAALGEGER